MIRIKTLAVAGLFFIPCLGMSHPLNVPQSFMGSECLINPYGITSHITWHGYDYDNYQKCFQEIAQSGSFYVRADFNQGGINWGKSNQSFAIWDDVVSEAKANGLQMAPLVYP